MITSDAGVCIVLIIWLIYIAISIYGCTQVKIDFKQSYLINSSSYVKNYMDLSDKFFNTGEVISLFMDNQDIDFTSSENQIKLH